MRGSCRRATQSGRLVRGALGKPNRTLSSIESATCVTRPSAAAPAARVSANRRASSGVIRSSDGSKVATICWRRALGASLTIACEVLVKSPASTIRPRDSATWPTISAPRSREWRRPPLCEPCLSSPAAVRRSTIHAGMSPVARETPSASETAKSNTRQSMLTNTGTMACTRARVRKMSPIDRPTATSTRASVSRVSSRTSWARLAPSASRTASSRDCSATRARCRLATFAQPIASTMIGSANTAVKSARIWIGVASGSNP